MQESNYGRMIMATVLIIITIGVGYATYAIVSWPLEYTVDAVQDAYDVITDQTGWEDEEHFDQVTGSLPYFLAGAFMFMVFLLIIWYFVYAHKKEHEVE